MGCTGSKQVGHGGKRQKKRPDDPPPSQPSREEGQQSGQSRDPDASARPALESTPSRGLPGGFRHTSGLRVGVIESKKTSVTLLNDYIVLGALGKGAYGSVKLCYSMQDDNLYALKVLQRAQLKRQLGPRPGSCNTQALDMLRRGGQPPPREVDVMRSMNHPNLIKIFEVIEADSKVVMVQEYAEAGPLQQPDHLMCESLAQYYFRQIVEGLAALHSQNVIHGDMKPDNVLLAGSGLVKIADFGQAQFFNEGGDVFDKTIGTPAFMAPEVRSGDSYHGKPADMWALGVTLYCFLFDDLPFKGATLEELYEAIQTQEVRYPEEPTISAGLRSVLDRLLSKDPAHRPTSRELMHHPWVAPAAEGRQCVWPDESMELSRMDDAPSLEKWMNDLAPAELAEPAELPLANEVAISVFGRDALENAQSINTHTIMGVIQEANTSVQPFQLGRSVTAPLRRDAASPPQPGSRRHDAASLVLSSDSSVAAVWQAAGGGEPWGSAASTEEEAPARLQPRLTRGGLGGEEAADPERLAAALEDLLGSFGRRQAAEGDAEEGAAAAGAGAGDHTQQQQQQRPGTVVNLRPEGGAASQATPFATAAGRPPSGPGSFQGPAAADAAAAHSPLALPSVVRSSLPISPFESNFSSAGASESVHLPTQRRISLNLPEQGARRAAALARPSLGGPVAPARWTGQRLESTGEVWDAMRSKAVRNKVPGVRFVSFPAGAAMDLPLRVAGNYCLLIESGIVDLRYVAVLPFNKLSQYRDQRNDAQGTAAGTARRDHSSGDDSAASASDSDSDSDEERRLERRDSLARGPEAQAVAPSRRKPRLASNTSLQLTVDRVLARAQRVLGSANSNSEANMLSSSRGPNDFLGIAAMLEPAQHRKLGQRWRPFFLARTEVRGVILSRQAVELVLKHYPLAQVYLRITLSKSRAEILQLESLENIASCLRPATPAGSEAASRRRGGPAGGPSSRLDLFRAVSFARQLAAQLAENVTELDPAAQLTSAANQVRLSRLWRDEAGMGSRRASREASHKATSRRRWSLSSDRF